MTRIRIQYRGVVVVALMFVFSYDVITVLTFRTTEALRASTTIRTRPLLLSSSSSRHSRIETTTYSLIKTCRWSATTRTATERNDDAASITNSTDTISLNSIRRKSSGAPVVDSTLLRFISQQQKQLSPDIFAVAKAGEEYEFGDGYDSSSTSAIDELKALNTAASASSEESPSPSSMRTTTTTNAVSTSKSKTKKRKKTTIQTAQTQSLANSLLSSFSALPTEETRRTVAVATTRKMTTTSSQTPTTPWSSSNTDNVVVVMEDKKVEAAGSKTDDDFVLTEEAQASVASVMEEKKVETATGAAAEQQQPSSPSSFSSSSSTQFSSYNVQQSLLSNADAILTSGDEAAAKRAGDAIERYVVARTARRRIRRFLRERDTVWDEVTNNANTRSSSSTTSSSSSSRQELESLASAAAALSPAAMLLLSYGGDEEEQESTGDFQDVVTVMKEYGLTFNDICILLTHSPNLALRVPRKSENIETIEISNNGVAEVLAATRETNTYTNTNKANNSEQQQQYAESLEETLDRSFKGLLQTTLKLRRYDARKVLRGCPNLLSVRGSKSACQIIVIMNKTGVSYSSLARDKNGLPTLLSRSPAGLFKLISFLSTTAVRMPIHQIGPLIRKPTSLLMDAVNPIPLSLQTEEQSLSNDEDDEEEEEAVWSSSRKARDVTAERKKEIESTYSDMTRTALILQKQIGSKDLSRVVAAYPQVLLLDAEKQILPVARYLMGGLGIWEDDLSSLLQLYPTLLGRRIDDLEKVVSYLVDELGVNEDDLGTIFRSFPVLFSLSIEKDMKPVVEYLKEHCGIGDNKDMLGSFITRLPPVLGYNVTTEIQPKWEYLKKTTLRPEWELNAFPAYFSYPFHRVIQTRFNYLSYKGMFWFATSNRIDTVLRFGDIDFATKIALDDDNGKAYKEFGQTQRTSSGNKNKAGTAAIKQKPWVTTKKKNNNKSSLASRSGGRGRTPDDVIRNLNADIRKSNSKKYRRRRKAAEAATAKAAAIASDEEAKKASSLSKKEATSSSTKTKTKKLQEQRRKGEGDDGFGASMAFPSPA